MERKKKLQTRIAGSRFSLPVTGIAVTAIWVLVTLSRGYEWWPLLLMLGSAALMMHLNKENALMRTFSNMVSCSFLVLSLMLLPQMQDWHTGLAQLFCILGYTYLFRAYQDQQGMGEVFTAHAMIGAASIFFPQVLYFVPILWVLLGTKLMALSLHTFLASLLGLLIPYWFWAGYLFFVQGDLTIILSQLSQLGEFTPLLDWQSQPHRLTAIAIFIFIVGMMGSIHFLRTAFNDKIRTRMIYEIFIIMASCTALFILLQPARMDMLLPLLIVNVSPLLAHYITFTHTRLTNASFFVLIALALLLAAINITWTA